MESHWQMAKPRKSQHNSGEPLVRTCHWLKWADSDYLAARHLLLGSMVVQGAILANTAIEKYLKALYAHLGLSIPRSHNVQALYCELTTSGKSTTVLNDSFLSILPKAYDLRYPDELPDGFNIAINQIKLLAELDRTVFAITNSFVFTEGTVDLVLARAAKHGDERFLTKNVVLRAQQTKDCFATDSRSFEFRIQKPLIINFEYLSPNVADDGLFDQIGAVLTPDKGVQLAFPRGPGELKFNNMFDWPK